MTKPLRHTKLEMETAARLAAELSLSVRLEADGAITFIPMNHDIQTINGIAKPKSIGQSPKAWQ